ncbi:MAG: hypothetical protein AB7J35_18975 [Dehalococcoidia bacterium]
MKTTVEVDDALLKAAKKAAIDRGTTLRRFLEAAIAAELARIQGMPEESVRKAEPQDDAISSILRDIATAAEEYRTAKQQRAS